MSWRGVLPVTEFSCPAPDDAADADSAAGALSLEFARQSLVVLLTEFPDRLGRCGDGLDALLEGWMQRAASPLDARHWSFGRLVRALAEVSEDDLSGTVAALALHLCSVGAVGTWSLRTAVPRRFSWGTLLLPPANQFQVDTDGQEATLLLTGAGTEHTICLRRTGGDWDGAEIEALPSVGSAVWKMILLDARAAPQLPGTDSQAISEGPGEQERAAFMAAWSELDSRVSSFARWVERVVTHLLPVRTSEEKIASGTFDDYPGLLYLSVHRDPMPMIESLVHEAAHQYFNLLTRIGPVHDGSDPSLYYSPAVDRNRPLDRILIAFHAFANVLLLYRAFGSVPGGGFHYIERNGAELERQVELLRQPLYENPALTDIGRALYRPLVERLHG